MATLYFKNTGNTSWSTIGNWSTTDGGASSGTVPTSADDVLLTALSGNCIIDVAVTIKSLNCTGYTGTLTFNANLTFSTSGVNIIFGSGMIMVGGTFGIVLNASGTYTITSNGVLIPTLLPSYIFGVTVIAMDTLNINIVKYTGDTIWSGNFGFIVTEYLLNNFSALNTTLKVGNNYIIKGRLAQLLTSGTGSLPTFKSSIGGTRATLTCTGEVTVANTKFTDIDASGGRTIYCFNGTITNCVNIVSMTDRIAPVNSTITASVIS